MSLIYKKAKNELLEFNNVLDDDERRDDYFRHNNDSFNGMPWNSFIQIVENYGFTLGYFAEFEGESKITEREAIYYLKEKGILLYAFTRGGFCVDNATLWGQFYAPHNNLDLTKIRGLSGLCTIYTEHYKAMEFFLDVKEGFVYKTDVLVTNFDFYAAWKSMGVLNFANYMERKYQEQQVISISYNKVEKCGKEVIDIVFNQYRIV